MTNEEKVKKMFPFYEDMDDVEIVQTTFKRAGAIEMAEWKDAQFEKVTRMLLIQLYAYSNEIGSKTVMTIIQQAKELYEN
jgi:hypothetical protein